MRLTTNGAAEAAVPTQKQTSDTKLQFVNNLIWNCIIMCSISFIIQMLHRIMLMTNKLDHYIAIVINIYVQLQHDPTLHHTSGRVCIGNINTAKPVGEVPLASHREASGLR